jgi:hypothetical protein
MTAATTRTRSAKRRWLVAWCVLALFTTGCRELDDCKLYNTCANDLIALARGLNGKDDDACTACLEDKCKASAIECSLSVACNYGSRVMLSTSPADYHQHLRALSKGGFSNGEEPRYPWEGSHTERAFGECLRDSCLSHCTANRFSCDPREVQYRDISLSLALRMVSGGFPHVANAKVRVCDAAEWDDSCSAKQWITDGDGVVDITEVPPFIPAANLYFEIEPGPQNNFPLTLYYPGLLGSSGRQLVPVYLVSNETVAGGNALLGRPRAVLKAPLSQSLILPDSCLWEEGSVENARVRVFDARGAMIPQCNALPSPCAGNVCTPCVWYAVDRQPTWTATMTDDSGAGIVGLSEGIVTIEVIEDASKEVVSTRTILLKGGAMTIARTWPLSLERRRAINDGRQ